MPRLPWIDPENFNPGYLTRSMHLLPEAGSTGPSGSTPRTTGPRRTTLPAADLDDGCLVFESAEEATEAS